MLSWQTELEESVEPLAVCKIEDSNDRLLQCVQVVDAYALIGDISGLAEKLQSFYMQEVLSETHSVLKNTVQEVRTTNYSLCSKEIVCLSIFVCPKMIAWSKY
jgi:SepF-like predicted cell division protein (DUF552 family)